MDELEVSYGWECHVCREDSFITFTSTDDAVNGAANHADMHHDGLLDGLTIVEVTEPFEDEDDWYDGYFDDDGY